MILQGAGGLDAVAWGAEATFYFNGDIRFWEQPSIFATRSNGVSDTSIGNFNDDRSTPTLDIRYDSSNCTFSDGTALVASDICFEWKPTQTQRWEMSDAGVPNPDSTIQDAQAFFQRSGTDLLNADNDSMFVSVLGHVVDGVHDASRLEQGTYIVQLKTDTELVTRTTIVAR
jgi:hypothetical protein